MGHSCISLGAHQHWGSLIKFMDAAQHDSIAILGFKSSASGFFCPRVHGSLHSRMDLARYGPRCRDCMSVVVQQMQTGELAPGRSRSVAGRRPASGLSLAGRKREPSQPSRLEAGVVEASETKRVGLCMRIYTNDDGSLAGRTTRSHLSAMDCGKAAELHCKLLMLLAKSPLEGCHGRPRHSCQDLPS